MVPPPPYTLWRWVVQTDTGCSTPVGDGAALSLHVGRCVDVRGPRVTANRLDVGLLYHSSVQHLGGMEPRALCTLGSLQSLPGG